MNLLIILGIFVALSLLLLSFLIAAWIDQRPGTVGGRPVLGSVIDQFTTKPTSITVGQPTEFVFQSRANNPFSTGSQLRPVAGRRVLFAVEPSPIVIVSINGIPVNDNTGEGLTDANGLISIIVLARGVPELAPLGGILGQAAQRGANDQKLSFSVESD